MNSAIYWLPILWPLDAEQIHHPLAKHFETIYVMPAAAAKAKRGIASLVFLVNRPQSRVQIALRPSLNPHNSMKIA